MPWVCCPPCPITQHALYRKYKSQLFPQKNANVLKNNNQKNQTKNQLKPQTQPLPSNPPKNPNHPKKSKYRSTLHKTTMAFIPHIWNACWFSNWGGMTNMVIYHWWYKHFNQQGHCNFIYFISQVFLKQVVRNYTEWLLAIKDYSLQKPRQ